MPEGRDADLPKLRHVREDNQLWRVLRAEWLSDPDRINGWLRVVGRLAPGADLHQAQRQLDLVAEHIREVSPDHAHVDFELHVSPVLDDLVRSARPMLLTLLGAVAFVLLICCFSRPAAGRGRAGGRLRPGAAGGGRRPGGGAARRVAATTTDLLRAAATRSDQWSCLRVRDCRR